MSLMQQANQQPKKFELFQLIRIVNRYTQASNRPFELVVEAEPMPDNARAQVSDFQLLASKAVIRSNKSSLTSGNAAVPMYIYEELLKAFHNEDLALFDFLNIFNDRYFKLYAKTVDKSHLLLSEELDRFARYQQQDQGQVHTSLMHCMSNLCALPVNDKTENWAYLGLLLGMGNRSIHNLQQALSHYFQLELKVWSKELNKHQLGQESWSRLGSDNADMASLKPQNTQLGMGLLAGQRCWLSRQRIIISVSPTSQQQLLELLENKDWYQQMSDMVRLHLRDKTEISIYLKAPGFWFPPLILSSDPQKTIRLGRGFHLKTTRHHQPIIYLIHLEKD